MAATLPTLRRTLLYVPASSSKFLEKSRTLPPIDNVTYDLEDSVTPSRKPEARKALRAFLAQPRPQNIRETAVRINSVDSGHALADLTEVAQAPNLDAIVVPKVNSPSDLHFVTDALRHLLPARHASTTSSPHSDPTARPPIKLLALIESARSLQNLPAITASTPLLSGLIFAAEDFALDLSLTRTPSLSEFLYARSTIVTAARAASLPSTIDLVCTSFRGPEGAAILRSEAEDGRRLGFNGKQVIHPEQVGVTQEVFGVSETEAEWAVRVVVAHEKAEARGRGAWSLDGRMVDAPVVGRARALVGRAGACGVDVGGLRERFGGTEPE